ncbi:hypothetical protein C8Q73DRAFT_188084 [Cubamyces lactineus]|nr:hypothetical protein C8Q73DRAFT_188084 [Cubamyces lactineus]
MWTWPAGKQGESHTKRAPEIGGTLSNCVWGCIETVYEFSTCTDSTPELTCLCGSTVAQDAALLCVNVYCTQNDDDALNAYLTRCPPQRASDSSSENTGLVPTGASIISQTLPPWSWPHSASTTSPNANSPTTTWSPSPTGAASGPGTCSVTFQSNSTESITSTSSKAPGHPITNTTGHTANTTVSAPGPTEEPSSSLPAHPSTTSVSPSPNATASSGHDSNHHPRTAMIVVSSLLGSLLFIGLVAALVLCIRRYRRHRARTPSRLEPFLLLRSASTSFDGDRRSDAGRDGAHGGASPEHHQPECKSRRPSANTSRCQDDGASTKYTATLAAPAAQSRCSLPLSALFSPSHVLHICGPPAPPELGPGHATAPSLSSLSSLSPLSRRAQNGTPSESVLSQPMEMHAAPAHRLPPGLVAAAAAASVSDLSDLSRRAQRGANSESGMSVEMLAVPRGGEGNGNGTSHVQSPCVAYVPRGGVEVARRGLQETPFARTIETFAVAY